MHFFINFIELYDQQNNVKSEKKKSSIFKYFKIYKRVLFIKKRKNCTRKKNLKILFYFSETLCFQQKME